MRSRFLFCPYLTLFNLVITSWGCIYMFRKLNPLLLAPCLALGASFLSSSSVVAGSSNGTVTITGTVTAFTSITVTPGGNSFTLTYNQATLTEYEVAKVSYITNVVGDWNISAQGGNAGKEGQLVAPGLTATIPYKVKIAGGYVQPQNADNLSSAILLANTIAPTDLTVLSQSNRSLRIQILQNSTKVPTLPSGSPYSETLTLVFSSGNL